MTYHVLFYPIKLINNSITVLISDKRLFLHSKSMKTLVQDLNSSAFVEYLGSFFGKVNLK